MFLFYFVSNQENYFSEVEITYIVFYDTYSIIKDLSHGGCFYTFTDKI